MGPSLFIERTGTQHQSPMEREYTPDTETTKIQIRHRPLLLPCHLRIRTTISLQSDMPLKMGKNGLILNTNKVMLKLPYQDMHLHLQPRLPFRQALKKSTSSVLEEAVEEGLEFVWGLIIELVGMELVEVGVGIQKQYLIILSPQVKK